MNRNPQSPGAAAGFTLLELLVVLVIIGIVSSFAVLSTGLADRNQPLDKESQRLLALMRMAGEEAVLKTEELGLTIDTDGYRFARYEDNAWQALDEDLFRERRLPDDVTLDLALEGRPIVLENPGQGDDDKEEKPKAPQILFLSSGEISPFVMTLNEHPGTAQRIITSNGDGSFTLGDGAEARQ